MSKIICPVCKKKAEITNTKYGRRNICRTCDLWSWGDAPLTDAETHKARIDAHMAFDCIWKSKMMTRANAYAWLSRSLGISAKKCHMKIMDIKTAEEVVLICRNFSSIGNQV